MSRAGLNISRLLNEMLRTLFLAMALSVTHTTPSDASFSAAGQAAWDDTHTVTGLAAVATSGAYGDLSGTPTIITLSQVYPIGCVYTSVRTTSPSVLLGFGTWSSLGEGQVLVGVATGTPAFSTVRATGGALLITSSGTISTPTFTGDNYTPSGSNAVVQFTPSGTNAVVQFTPSGTNAISLFREAVSGTNADSVASGSVSVQYPTGVPTFAGTTVTVSVSVNWPTAKPIFTGATATAHQHELPIVHTSNTSLLFLPTGTFGVGASRIPDVRVTATGLTASANLLADVTNSGVVMLSQTAGATVASTGTVAWPVSVPQAVQSAGNTPAGIISWPATAPTAVFKTGTAAAQVFTGVTGSVSGQIFTGTIGTVSGQVFTGTTGTVSGQLFTGVAKAPTGSVSKPTYVGDPTSVVQPFFTVYFWERTA